MTALRDTLLAAGDRTLLRDMSGAAETGGDLVAHVDRLAGALVERGLQGSRIGLWHSNSFAALEATLAVEWLGGARIPMDPNASAAEVMATWHAAGADAWIVDREHASQLDGPALIHDNDQRLVGAPAEPVGQVDPNATIVVYPRGIRGGELIAIPISYGNWDATMQINCQFYRDGTYGPGFDPDTEVFLTAQQIMHGTGLMGTFPFLHMGLPQVIMRRYTADDVLSALREKKVTATVMPTLMLRRAAESITASGGDAGSLRRLLYGGAPIPPDEMRRICQTLPGVLTQVFGRIEGGWPLAALSASDHDRIAAGELDLANSCGRPLPSAGQIRLRDSGEIIVRSPMTVHEFADKDGWCGLGDLGEFRDDYLYLRGRLDRQINTGYHVYPGEIEDALLALPQVVDAFVRGEPDPRHGEQIVAYVIARSGSEDAEKIIGQLETALRGKIAAYKVPRIFHLVAELPEPVHSD